MREADTLKELTRYARVARNSQMLLVMEPPDQPTAEVEKVRGAIAQDAFDYLNEVLEGVESPYFVPYTRQDRKYIDLIAASKIRQSAYDRYGIFTQGEEAVRLQIPDASEAQAATFAYLAASIMRDTKTPFYQAPSLRGNVSSPHNLAEFIDTVELVKDVTVRATTSDEFHQVVTETGWRKSFAFWEANRRLAGMIGGIA